jgi:hypothetical protein
MLIGRRRVVRLVTRMPEVYAGARCLSTIHRITQLSRARGGDGCPGSAHAGAEAVHAGASENAAPSLFLREHGDDGRRGHGHARARLPRVYGHGRAVRSDAARRRTP